MTAFWVFLGDYIYCRFYVFFHYMQNFLSLNFREKRFPSVFYFSTIFKKYLKYYINLRNGRRCSTNHWTHSLYYSSGKWNFIILIQRKSSFSYVSLIIWGNYEWSRKINDNFIFETECYLFLNPIFPVLNFHSFQPLAIFIHANSDCNVHVLISIVLWSVCFVNFCIILLEFI